MKYRRKSGVVEAFKWDGGSTPNPKWFDLFVKNGRAKFIRKGDSFYCNIATPHGLVKCNVGDFVVMNGIDDVYPVAANKFFDLYEEVSSGKVRNNSKG